MNTDFKITLEQAARHAPYIDAIFYALVGVTAFFVVLIFGLIIVLALKYRKRPGQTDHRPEGNDNLILEIGWSIIPLFIGLGFFVWGAVVYVDTIDAPANSMDIYVIGKQWMWKAEYPNGVREINELHVPVGQPVKLTMVSQDVIHSFFVPAFRNKMDVLPMRYTTMWFEATKPGRYRINCAQYCGTKHSEMVGWVTVLEPSAFQEWYQNGELAAQGSPKSRGQKIMETLGCNACHKPDSAQLAPMHVGLFGSKVELADGRVVVADENYLRESIINPKAKVVKGYQAGVMPSYQGQVSEEDLVQIIAYLKSVGRGK